MNTTRQGNTRSLGALALSLVSAGMLLTFAASNADARGGGGGGRSGAMATSSVSSANRSTANAGNANRSNVNSGNVSGGNGNRGNINTGNVNNVQGGNRNTNINIDNSVNIDGGYNNGYRGGVQYPVAAGAMIGAMAVTTAAVVGSYYYALPPSGCTTVITNGVTYQRCGSAYYQQTWQGDTVVYVVVNP